jgi:hypothetical protein
MKLKEKLTNAFNRATEKVMSPFISLKEALLDIWAGATEKDAMPASQKHIDEYKLLAGSVLTVAGAVEVNPLAAAGGSIPAAEAIHDFEKSGRKWREDHHRI